MFELRAYQQDGLSKLRAAYSRGVRALLYVLATGGGKTFVFCAIALGAVARGHKSLILTHRRQLLRQASLSLARLGLPHLIIAPPKTIKAIEAAHVAAVGRSFLDPDAMVAVASLGSLARRIAWLIEWAPALLILDEAHHVAAKVWAKIVASVPRAWLLGVTATPTRLDGKGLRPWFKEMILGPDMPELVELGALCPVRCWAPPCKADLSKAHILAGDYVRGELAELLDHPHITGDAIEHYETLCPGEPALVFCVDVAHARNVCAAFCARGWRFEVLVGDTDGDERDRQLDGLAAGQLDGVVSVDVLVEGTDVPAAVVVIGLRPTESLPRFLQMAGRNMRPAPGKLFGRYHDHVGNIKRHGLPQAVRAWTLDGVTRGERGQVDPALRVVMCPVCFYAAEPREVCGGELPNGAFCEYVFPVQARTLETVAGTLEEIDQAEPEKIQTGKGRDYATLRAMGCSHGRAQHILIARAERAELEAEVLDTWHAWHDRHPGELWPEPLPLLKDIKPKAMHRLIAELTADMVDEVEHGQG